MKRKFFGSESSLQRQFIASGLTGVFALSAVGSSYAGAMLPPETEQNFFQKHKVPVIIVGASILALAAIVIILLPTVIFPAFKPKKTDTEERKEQGDAKTEEPSSTENQVKNKDQEPSDIQGEKKGNGINKGLIAGGVAAGTLAIGGSGAIIAKNMMDNKKGEETSSGGEYMFIKGKKVPKEAKNTDAENLDAKNKDSAAGEGNEGNLAVEKKKEDEVDVLDADFGKEKEQNDGIKKDDTGTK